MTLQLLQSNNFPSDEHNSPDSWRSVKLLKFHHVRTFLSFVMFIHLLWYTECCLMCFKTSDDELQIRGSDGMKFSYDAPGRHGLDFLLITA